MLHDPRHPSALRRAATRRDFVKSLAAAATATLGLPEPLARAVAAGDVIAHPQARADAIIVLWMAGGMAAPDNLDPKKYKPFEPGLAVPDVISTFPAIPTAVDGVQICQGLEEIASVLDRARSSARMCSPIWAASCTHGINTTGTPATCHHRPSPARTSAPG